MAESMTIGEFFGKIASGEYEWVIPGNPDPTPGQYCVVLDPQDGIPSGVVGPYPSVEAAAAAATLIHETRDVGVLVMPLEAP